MKLVMHMTAKESENGINGNQQSADAKPKEVRFAPETPRKSIV